jgi:hypothetical protein
MLKRERFGWKNCALKSSENGFFYSVNLGICWYILRAFRLAAKCLFTPFRGFRVFRGQLTFP